MRSWGPFSSKGLGSPKNRELHFRTYINFLLEMY